jgi:hypothetical protein
MKLTSILLLVILALFRDSFVFCGESSVEEQPQIELASKNDDPSHFFRKEIENRDLSHYHGHHGHHGHHHGSYPYPPYRGKVVYIAKLRPNTNDDHVEVIRVPPHFQSYPHPKSKGKGKGKGGKGKGGKGKGGKGKGGYGKGGKGGYAGYGW